MSQEGSQRSSLPQGQLRNLIDILFAVGRGDLAVKVPRLEPEDELAELYTAVGLLVEQLKRTAYKQARVESDLNSQIERQEGISESILASLPLVVVVVDRKLRILFINHLVPGMGYNKEEVIGQPMYKFSTPKEHERLKPIFEGVFTTGQPASYESFAVSKDGSHRTYRVTVTTVDGFGQPAIALISTDISEERDRQEELEKRNLELEKLNRLMVGREIKMVELKQKLIQFEERQEKDRHES